MQYHVESKQMHSIKYWLPYSQTDFLYYTPKTFHLQTYCKKSIWPLNLNYSRKKYR